MSVSSGGTTTNGGSVFPGSSQALTYDEDGNLTFDGVLSYQWDGENRLKSMNMTNVAGVPNANRVKLDFAYDYLGRRVQKIVSTWNGNNAFINPSTNRFIYDGWNLIAVINPSLTILQSFVWGQDLSGTMTKAGGVGGLLMANFSGTNCFAAYDGNGNITALINAADKSTSARYEYNPYGQLIRTIGLLAKQNPFRFSTKFWDEESGLVYYGYRYYSPAQGRWIGRDPFNGMTASLLASVFKQQLSESLRNASDPEFLRGGMNLYCFVDNQPLSAFDADGRFLLWDLLFGETTMRQLAAEQAAVFTRIAGSLATRLYEGIIFVPYSITYLAGVGAARAYSATQALLYANPTLAYEGGMFFTGAIGLQPGPPDFSSPGSVAGNFLNGIFDAWMDYVTDPNTH